MESKIDMMVYGEATVEVLKDLRNTLAPGDRVVEPLTDVNGWVEIPIISINPFRAGYEMTHAHGHGAWHHSECVRNFKRVD